MFRYCISFVVFVALCVPAPLIGQQVRDVLPNYRQAEQFSPDYLRQRTYSTSVSPNWIGETDRFWYSYRTSEGTRYYIVDPAARTKAPLFDHIRLAALLSIEVRKPIDLQTLELSNTDMDDEGKVLTFVVERTRFQLDLATGNLTNLGALPQQQGARGARGGQGGQRGQRGRGRGRGTQGGGDGGEGGNNREPDPRAHRNFSPDRTAYVFAQNHNLFYVEASDEVKEEIKAIEERLKAEREAEKAAAEQGETTQTEEQNNDQRQDDERQDDQEQDDDEEQDQDETDNAESNEEQDEDDDVDERERWADDIDEAEALQLTDDGEEDYEFPSGRGGRGGRGGARAGAAEVDDFFGMEEADYIDGLQAGDFDAAPPLQQEQEQDDDDDDDEADPDRKTRPGVNWAADSTAFYATRRDSRGVAQLYLVNSLSEPRPTLESYSYSMPGEEKIAHSELFIFDRASKEFRRVKPKWKDESYRNLHWPNAPQRDDDDDDDEDREFTPEELAGAGDELRMVRVDRLLRNAELCSIDVRTGEATLLFEEGLNDATLALQSPRFLNDRDEMIWWSERSGWGHFYLYDKDGKLKNPITTGSFRASRIVEVDEEKGLLYFTGNAREPGENVYYQHLYSVFLDGTGLKLMDPGDADHRSELSPSRKYLVDNCSRADMAPISRLCDADGKQLMMLEESDLSRLYEAGWTMPERFTFKAADGVTDLYGNMWKPFDFDPEKKYPIIAEVYPGPQTEGVGHTFSASNARQQLAQVGFIVVQLGHRGGTPGRSKAYHSYGYFNLRDYGLADKKAGIEQLAERYPFIDIDRVGLYGHSGGGFMTAAALMLPPYNDFFKVGVSSAGNHDNNVYNHTWSERYHGLRVVEQQQEAQGQRGGRGGRGQRGGGRGGRGGGGNNTDGGDRDSTSQDQDGQNQDGERQNNDNDNDNEDEDEDENQDEEKDEDQRDTDDVEINTQFEIHIPTNAELAANLKGNLLLVHGDMDNNVHPAGTIRLVDALIKANKRFDLLIIPGARHGFGAANDYFTQRKWEFFAEHLLGDRQTNADITVKD